MRFFATLSLILITSPFVCFAGGRSEVSIYPMLQYQTWKEYPNDNRALRDEGFMAGIGISAALKEDASPLALKVLLEAWGGGTDVEGRSANIGSLQGNPRFSSNGEQFGTRFELDLGARAEDTYLSLEPFAGIGYRLMVREIERPTGSDDFEEAWNMVYNRFGLRSRFHRADNSSVIIEGGALYTLYTANSSDEPLAGANKIYPKRDWGSFFEVGVQKEHLRPTIFFEDYRFRQSKSDFVGNNPGTGLPIYMIQPETRIQIIGFKLNIDF